MISNNKELSGIWVRYEHGSSYVPLFSSLQGKGVQWYISDEELLSTWLKSRDFYIYYTKDLEEKYTIPQMFIRINPRYGIEDVRGRGEYGAVDADLLLILKQKLDDFKEDFIYRKKVNDMLRLEEIEQKHRHNIFLTKKELEFLYEIFSPIDYFGGHEDPRIFDMRRERNAVDDICTFLECSKEQVATDVEQLYQQNDIIAFVGDLAVKENCMPSCFSKLKYVYGHLDCSYIEQAENLENLIAVFGNLFLCSLTDARNLSNLQSVRGSLYTTCLEKAEGLHHLKYVGREAYFKGMKYSKGLENLNLVRFRSYFDSLKDDSALACCNRDNKILMKK